MQVYYGSSSSPCLQADYPMERNSIFRIYSMTKPIAAVGVLILAEKGLLRLDDDISVYLPSFAMDKMLVARQDGSTEALTRPITILDLLSHTSGITYGIFGNNVGDVSLRAIVGDKNVKVEVIFIFACLCS